MPILPVVGLVDERRNRRGHAPIDDQERDQRGNASVPKNPEHPHERSGRRRRSAWRRFENCTMLDFAQ